MNKILEEYKNMMCTHCVNRCKEDKCRLVIKIDGEADCINCKCEDYCRERKKKDEGNNYNGNSMFDYNNIIHIWR